MRSALLGLALCLPSGAFADPPTGSERLHSLGMRLDSPEAERLRLDSAFDGKEKEAPPSLFQPLEKLGQSLEIQNGGLRRFAIIGAGGDWQLEAGQLGLNARNPLLGRSPYVGFRKTFDRDGALHATLKLQAGILGLRSRLFYDDAPELDVQVDSTVAQARAIAEDQKYEHLEYFDWIKDQTKVDTSFDQTTMFVGSALGQVGRTLKLWGPVDLGLVAGGVARFLYRFPGGAVDQTAALRLRLPGGVSLGVFGGVNEALGYLDKDVWQKSLQANDFKHHIHLDAAPHIGAEVWGPLPKLSDSRFSVGTTYQSNPMTDWTEAHAEAWLPIKSGGLRLAGGYEQEIGSDIEYERRRGGAELGVQPSANLEVWGSYGKETFKYGLADADNQTVWIGLRGREKAGRRAISVAIEQAFGGQDSIVLPTSEVEDVIRQIEGLADFIDAVEAARKAEAGQKLDEAMRGEIAAELGSNKQSIGDLVRLAGALVPAEVYERIIVRYLRHRLLDQMSKKTLPIMGQHLILTPGAIVALVGVYQTGLAPVPPLTAPVAKNALAGYLFGQMKGQVGECQDSADASAFTTCLLDKLPPDAAQRLKDQYGDQASQVLESTLRWGAELLAREVDRQALMILLMSEQVFSELTVDGGAKLTRLDRAWLVSEFEKRDKAAFKRVKEMAVKTRASLDLELKAREKDLKAKLTAYGKARLSELPGVDIPKKDLAPLIDFYGDDALFGFAEAAKSRLPAGRKLVLEFNPFADIGVSIGTDADVTTIRLPPPPPRKTPQAFLDGLLPELGS